MFRLRCISVINWYLIGRKDIEIDGMVGVYGENKSGKSSLLDAIQVTMLSNHGRATELNSAANAEKKKKNKRSVQAYCLGRIGGPAEPPLREDARTHLALTFIDDVSGEAVSTGLVIEARITETKADVVGRWIAKGIAITTADLVDGEGAPLTWQALEGHLEDRCRDEGGIYDPGVNPEAHIADFLHKTAQSGRHGGIDQFMKAFANAVSFETIEDETDFIRTYVLEKRHINIRGLRESISSWREIRATIAGLEDQVRRLGEIEAEAGEVQALRDEMHLVSAAADRAQAIDGALRFRSARAKEKAAQAVIDARDKLIENHEAAIKDLREQLAAVQRAADHGAGAVALADLKGHIHTLENERRDADDAFAAWRVAVLRAASVFELPANAEGLIRLQALAPDTLGSLGDLRRAALPGVQQGAFEIGRILPKLATLPKAVVGLQEASEEARMTKAAADKVVRDHVAMLEGIAKEGRAISEPTQRFLAELVQMGMQPRLVCAEIELLDDIWRDAAEVVLGRDREAVILPPDEAEEAVRFLRQNRRAGGFFGCRVVNTRNIKQRVAEPRSLASVIRADDEVVRAFINQRVGSVRLVETERELHAGGRAVTKDCAYHDGLVSEIRRVDTYKIGAQASSIAETREREALQAAREAAAAAMATVRSLEDIVARLQPLEAALASGRSFRDDLDALESLDRRLVPLREQRDVLLNEQDPNVSEELKRIPDEIAAYEGEIRQARKEREGAADARTVAQVAMMNVKGQFPMAFTRWQEARRSFGISNARANAAIRDGLTYVRDKETGRKVSEFGPAVVKLRSQYKNLNDTLPNRQSVVHGLVQQFWRETARKAPFGYEASMLDVRTWAEQLRTEIIEHDIIRFREQAEEAEQEALSVFKGSFITELRDRFQAVSHALDVLNSVLKKRKFHGERYRFSLEPDGAYRDIIDLVEAASIDDTVLLPLFSGRLDGSVHADTLKTVISILEDEDADIGKYEDYRNYYRFTLEMVDVETGSSTTFAHRLGVGSGAEKQVPFYVTIGAALSGAYYGAAGQQADKPGGVGLALFDEAFMKMDLNNQREVLQFYDEIGLQPVIAGPAQARAFMQRQMDTMVRVARPSFKKITITTYRPGVELRKALATINPAEWSREQVEEMYKKSLQKDQAEQEPNDEVEAEEVD